MIAGNTQGWELKTCIEYNILATVVTEEAILCMGRLLQRTEKKSNVYQGYRNAFVF